MENVIDVHVDLASGTGTRPSPPKRPRRNSRTNDLGVLSSMTTGGMSYACSTRLPTGRRMRGC